VDDVVILRWGSVPPELAEALGTGRALNAEARSAERAAVLFDALGADVDDERFELVELADARLALFGRRVEGARFAIEPEPPKSVNPWRLR
jgi:hypothetical protein